MNNNIVFVLTFILIQSLLAHSEKIENPLHQTLKTYENSFASPILISQNPSLEDLETSSDNKHSDPPKENSKIRIPKRYGENQNLVLPKEPPGEGRTLYDKNRQTDVQIQELTLTDNLKLKKRVKDIYANLKVEFWIGRTKRVGTLRIKLYHLQAPQTVENFVNLAEGNIEFQLPGQDKPQKRPFYDGLTFHRIIKKFVAQTGDPTGNNKGAGPGYTIPLEFHARLVHDRMGVVSMVRAGNVSHGSQFFITLAPIPSLNEVNTVFGQVIDGARVLDELNKVVTNKEDVPKKPVIIKSLNIEKIYL